MKLKSIPEMSVGAGSGDSETEKRGPPLEGAFEFIVEALRGSGSCAFFRDILV